MLRSHMRALLHAIGRDPEAQISRANSPEIADPMNETAEMAQTFGLFVGAIRYLLAACKTHSGTS